MEIGNTLDKINNFEVFRIPIGAGVYYKATEQIAEFVENVIGHFLPVPPIVSGLAASWALRLPVVEKFLGKYGSFYASMAAAGGAIDDQFHLSAAIQNLFGKVENAIPAQGATSGMIETDNSADESNNSVGELPAQTVNSNDADLYKEWVEQFQG